MTNRIRVTRFNRGRQGADGAEIGVLEAVVEPGVLHRDRSLRGKVLEHLPIIAVVVFSFALGTDGQHTYYLVTDQHRRDYARLGLYGDSYETRVFHALVPHHELLVLVNPARDFLERVASCPFGSTR